MRRWENIPHINYPNITITEQGTGCTITEKNDFRTKTLLEFPGDCGTLTLQGCNNITKELLDCVKDVASSTGFDTVIGTVVNLTEETPGQIEIFKQAGWRRVVAGKSNRKYNYEKNHKFVFILHIKDCKHKGY